MAKKGELKAVDVFRASMAFNTTGTVTLLNGLIPGTNQWNRIGRRVNLKSVLIIGDVNETQTPTTPALFDHMRLILVYDKQSNGVAPTFANVIALNDNAGNSETSAQGMLNLSNSDRFRILRDWHWKLGADSTTGSTTTTLPDKEISIQHSPHQFKAFVNLKGLDTHFNTGTAGTVADITTGGLFLLSFGLNAAADDRCSVTFNSRLRFFDP